MTYLEMGVVGDSLSGAFTTIEHSVRKRIKKLLLVCGPSEGESLEQEVGAPDLEIVKADSGADALVLLRDSVFDGIMINSETKEVETMALVADIQAVVGIVVPPIIMLTSRDLTSREEILLREANRSGVVKRVKTLEQALDESVLLLHRAERELRPDQVEILEQLRQTDLTLSGKAVLIVDDDVRNIFALTSLLEDHHLKVLHAENGRAAIELLEKTPDIDVVLMDIMMPEMDGYETMRAIRQVPRFKSLPIVALTAKAMKGDRAKCIEAGASDYVTKPVDLDQLFSVLRVSVSKENVQVAGR
jgi:CheY-like chemotaxis protein